MPKCPSHFYDKVTSIFISAIILFAALAWRDCMVVYVNNHPRVKSYGSTPYTIGVTILAIIVVILLMYPLRYVACGSVYSLD